MNIKLIWDFRGPDALRIAEHHAIHLNEFLQRENYSKESVGVEAITPLHAIAFLLTNQENMLIFRDALKPMRAVKND